MRKRTISDLLLLIVLCFNFVCKTNKTVYSEEGTKEVNGTRLYYKVLGEGEPIVLLHGGPGFEHTYLMPQMGKLSERFKLIFYDQRGSGGSSIEVDSSSITIDNFVEDLEGIRKEFGLKKMNLLGHSWGGLLAMLYTIKYPDNLNSLMLINTAPARSEFWDDMRNEIYRNRSSEDSIALAELRESDGFKNNNPDAVERFYKIFFKSYFYNQDLADSLSLRFTETTLRNMFLIYSLYDYLYNFNIIDKLSAIKCRTLIIHGDADPIPVSYIEEIDEKLTNSSLVILKNCGHFPYIEMPDELFELINDFMKDGNQK